ncbi:hypothetical protein JTE90_013091 [Oedothorax gibbosus]|uniref:Protein vein n=1 Tax=Oedothorax gibbosus TaxID=931172 RepID=A0AAV6UJY9_9ARAC|nr:hypothetical protein JTE90_013091 [Oedothorax gibbosus]
MRLYLILRHLLLVIFCLSSLWMVAPCLDVNSTSIAMPTNVLCLGGSKRHPKQRRHVVNFSAKSLIDEAQTRAYLSPDVFTGSLRSVLVQRDGTVRAWFSVDNVLKAANSSSGGLRRKEDIEVVYHRSGEEHCILEVNHDNLKLGSQYLVFGVAAKKYAWPSLAATALPIPNEKRTLRAVKKILCKDCAKPPGVSGLEKTKVEEGSRVRLNCHLAGNPVPWVEWYKDGVKVSPRGRIRVKTKRRTSRLIIRRVRPSDRGIYACKAGNIVQKDPVLDHVPLLVTRKKVPKKTPATTVASTTVAVPTSTLPSTQSSPWATEPCPTSDFFLNGGTCIFFKAVREYVCHCAEGFIGLRCDYKDVSISVGEVKNYSSRGDIP